MEWKIELGPRQAKPVQQLLAAFSRESKTFVELYGTVGRPETEHRSAFTVMVGGWREDVAAALEKLKAEFPTVNTANLGRFYERAQDELAQLAKTRPEKDKRISAEEHDARVQRMAENSAKIEATHNRAAECWAILERLKPANAQALIVAEERHDKSDMMTDYFAYSTGRRVAIGWRTGAREDFRQLRQAAAQFEPTAIYRPGFNRWQVWAQDEKGDSCGTPLIEGRSLYIYGTEEEARSEAEKHRAALRVEWEERGAMGMTECNFMLHGYTLQKHEVEHRENWSMGAGNYVGDSKYSGWIVKSYELKYSGTRSDVVETEYLEVLCAKPQTVKQPDSQAPRGWDKVEGGGSAVTISENDEKDGLELRFAEKPAAEVLARVKAAGWRWSRFSSCWYAKRSEQARAFAQEIAGAVQ